MAILNIPLTREEYTRAGGAGWGALPGKRRETAARARGRQPIAHLHSISSSLRGESTGAAGVGVREARFWKPAKLTDAP
jgi:hypothetical protein